MHYSPAPVRTGQTTRATEDPTRPVQARARAVTAVAGWKAWIGGLCALALAAFYLVQPLRNGPNMVDEGLLVSVLDALAHGKTLHFEVLDLYGPAHWAPQTWAYQAAGERLLGPRLYLLGLKLIGLGLSVGLAWRLSGWLAAALTYLWLTLLLGVPWQLLQAPYPFLQAWVLALGAYHLLLFHRAAERPAVAALAGALCGLAITTKLNTGLLLLGGGLFVLSFGTTADAPVKGSHDPARRGLPPAVGLAGLALFVGTLSAAIWPHMGLGYALHLLLPLGLVALWTGRGIVNGALRTRARPAIVYTLGAAVSSGLVLGATFGVAHAGTYLTELATIIAALDYSKPMVPPGEPGTFVGFNEAYWPQLGWLTSAAFALLLWRSWHDRAQGTQKTGRLALARVGLFALVTTHGFVIYSRPDESHIYQAVIALVPLWFALASAGIEALSRNADNARGSRSRGAPRSVLQWGLVLFALALVPSLWVPPGSYVLTTYPTPWLSPHLAGVDFRAKENPYVRPAFFSDRRGVDRKADQAARFLKDHADPTDTVLVLTYDELFPYNAGLQHAGGRNRYLFYLLKNGFIDRARFEALAPGLLPFLIAHPPDWLIGLPGPLPTPLLDAVPEFAEARKTRYTPVRLIGHVQLHRRVR